MSAVTAAPLPITGKKTVTENTASAAGSSMQTPQLPKAEAGTGIVRSAAIVRQGVSLQPVLPAARTTVPVTVPAVTPAVLAARTTVPAITPATVPANLTAGHPPRLNSSRTAPVSLPPPRKTEPSPKLQRTVPARPGPKSACPPRQLPLPSSGEKRSLCRSRQFR